jgi:hypothetical protein
MKMPVPTANRSALSIAAALLAAGLVFLSAGCGYEAGESVIEEGANASTGLLDKGNATGSPAEGNSQTDGGTRTGGNGGTVTNATEGAVTENPDTVPFGALRWKFGNFNGARAKLSSPRLANLKCSNNTLTYKWVTGMAGWGLSGGNAGAVAAAFVQKSDGTWVGGKFDWVSTSRTSRGLENIRSGYAGWSLAGVPNPCQICFVVVDANGTRRSNVIGPATWQR